VKIQERFLCQVYGGSGNRLYFGNYVVCLVLVSTTPRWQSSSSYEF